MYICTSRWCFSSLNFAFCDLHIYFWKISHWLVFSKLGWNHYVDISQPENGVRQMHLRFINWQLNVFVSRHERQWLFFFEEYINMQVNVAFCNTSKSFAHFGCIYWQHFFRVQNKFLGFRPSFLEVFFLALGIVSTSIHDSLWTWKLGALFSLASSWIYFA